MMFSKIKLSEFFYRENNKTELEKNRRFVSEGICLDIQGVADSKILKAGFTPIAFGWCMSKRHLPLQFCDFFGKKISCIGIICTLEGYNHSREKRRDVYGRTYDDAGYAGGIRSCVAFAGV